MIAPTAIINGLGRSIGLDIIQVKGATGDYHSDYIAKVKAAIANFEDKEKGYNFGFLHIKAVDDAGHDKSLEKKQKYLEKVNEMVGYFI